MKKILISIVIFLIIILGVLVYSRFIGTANLNTNEIIINSDISNSFNGLKIVHFSDLHYKKVITEKRVKEVIDEINKIDADIVIFTGDLINKDYKLENSDINFLTSELSRINSKYGLFAILGDNDLSDIEVIKNIYIRSNFTLLDNSYSVIYNENNDKILISDYVDNNIPDINNTNIYKIILTHETDKIDSLLAVNSNIDLILGGHSLNGSVNLPFIKELFLPEGAKKYYEDYYKINNTDIYISNGIGVDKINFRLNNTPSINFYRLRTK